VGSANCYCDHSGNNIYYVLSGENINCMSNKGPEGRKVQFVSGKEARRLRISINGA